MTQIKRITSEQLQSMVKGAYQRYLSECKIKAAQRKPKTLTMTEGELRNLVTSSVRELVSNAPVNELKTATMRAAYRKMKDYGQTERASNFKQNSSRIVYDTFDPNSGAGIMVSYNMQRLEVSMPGSTREGDSIDKIYKYSFEQDDWVGDKYPKTRDRKAALAIANVIKQEDPESMWADKNWYIA